MLPSLMLTGVAQAAVISKSHPQSIAPSPSLADRSALVHDWAIVCLHDRDATNYCQKTYGYGCDSMGTKRCVNYYESCDVLCVCINIRPKPVCMVGLTGSSWCLRSLDDGFINDDPLEPWDISSIVPTLPQVSSEDLERLDRPILASSNTATTRLRMPRDAGSKKFSHVAYIPSPPSVIPQDSRRWSLACTGEQAAIADCADAGHSCDVDGNIRFPEESNPVCADLGTCIDRLLEAFFDPTDTDPTDSDETDAKKELMTQHILERHPSSSELVSRDRTTANIPHNYAMVCAGDKQETVYCQQDSYFCNANGDLVVPTIANKFCTDYCVCVDVGLRMYCMMGSSGAMYCLRSIDDQDLLSLESPYDSSLTTRNSLDLVNKSVKSSEEDGTLGGNSSDEADDLLTQNEGTQWDPHHMAMVCWNDKHLTQTCAQEYGYYCTSSGILARKVDGVENLACEDNCVCTDLMPKPNGIINWTVQNI